MKLKIIFLICFMIVFWTGWGMNIYKLVKCDFETPYKTEIIRGIAIIPPVGAVAGWMDIGEENNN